jgi:citrate lyase subunit beta/citryl-CoA lyase
MIRSFLFTPANVARRVEKALTLEADAVILDLEDSVAAADKVASRKSVVEALARPRRGLAYVRVNAPSSPYCYGDLVETVQKGLDGIVVPKIESAADLHAIDWLVANLERERGIAEGSLDLMPQVETAAGVQRVDRILQARSLRSYAAPWRVKRICFGAADYGHDLGLSPSLDEPELADARARVVLSSKAAGMENPIDSPWFHFKETEAFSRALERSRRGGFPGPLLRAPGSDRASKCGLHAERHGDCLGRKDRRCVSRGGETRRGRDPGRRPDDRLPGRLSCAGAARRRPQAEVKSEVVLVPGLWMPGAVMALLAARLGRAGYRTSRFSYRGRDPLDANLDRLARYVDGRAVHFVGHSLGGVLIYDLLCSRPGLASGRVVLLGAPVRGCFAGRASARRPSGAGCWAVAPSAGPSVTPPGDERSLWESSPARGCSVWVARSVRCRARMTAWCAWTKR